MTNTTSPEWLPLLRALTRPSAPLPELGKIEAELRLLEALGGPRQFTVRATEGGTRRVVGYRVAPGLAVTLDAVVELGWRLTHERSGLALCRGVWNSPVEAIEAATLYEGIDLDRPATQLQADEDIREADRLLSSTTRLSSGGRATPAELGDL